MENNVQKKGNADTATTAAGTATPKSQNTNGNIGNQSSQGVDTGKPTHQQVGTHQGGMNQQ